MIKIQLLRGVPAVIAVVGMVSMQVQAQDAGWGGAPSAVHPYFAEAKAISGSVTLSGDLIDRGYAKKDFSFTDSDVLFIIARRGTESDSPPVAVKRIANLKGKAFPIKYEIGPDDVMMAGNDQFIGPFSLKIKLSRHGSASTEPGDLIGYSTDRDIKMGSQNINVEFTEVATVSSGGGPKGQEPGHPGVDSSAKTASVPPGKGSDSVPNDKIAAAIEGHVVLSPDLEAKMKAAKFSFAETDAIFVIAKDAASSGNQPLAVTRIADLKGRTFPIPFVLSSANLMGDGNFVGPFLLKAKLSRQGGVQTQKGDLVGDYIQGKVVRGGDKGIKVVLTTLAD